MKHFRRTAKLYRPDAHKLHTLRIIGVHENLNMYKLCEWNICRKSNCYKKWKRNVIFKKTHLLKINKIYPECTKLSLTSKGILLITQIWKFITIFLIGGEKLRRKNNIIYHIGGLISMIRKIQKFSH